MLVLRSFCATTDKHEVPGCPGKPNIEIDDMMTEIPTLTSDMTKGDSVLEDSEVAAPNNILPEIEDVPPTDGENAVASSVETILSQMEDKPMYSETAASISAKMICLD